MISLLWLWPERKHPATAHKTGASPVRSHLFSLSVVYGTMVAVTSSESGHDRSFCVHRSFPFKRCFGQEPVLRSPGRLAGGSVGATIVRRLG